MVSELLLIHLSFKADCFQSLYYPLDCKGFCECFHYEEVDVTELQHNYADNSLLYK